MTSQADQTINALRTGHDELVAVVKQLGPDELVRTSGSSEWTVAQVLSHLGSGAEIHLAAVEAALAGADQGVDFKSVWARWDGMSPAEQAANFPVANETLLLRFEEMDERTRTELRIKLAWLPEPVDVATVAGGRLAEFALHAWDVLVAFDAAATVRPEATTLLLDMVGGLIGFAGKADRIDGTVRLAVHTIDPSRSFGLVIADTVSLTEVTADAPADADGELTAPAEFVIRLVSGRHGAAYTPESVLLTGDAVTLDDLRRVFPGY
jgi:uncharacterized protein (TIGR03083 family)